MAHELDTIDGAADGKKALFAVGGSVWHDPENSVMINEAPTLAKALELAGQEFEVEKTPLYVRRVGESGEEYFTQLDTGHVATIRTDRNKVLGVVGGRYHVLQNHEAFAVLEPLLDAGLVTLETGGTLREGRDVWMLAKFNIQSPIVQEVYADEVVPYGLLANNHAGWRQVTVMNTPVRVVCANTLGIALAAGAKGAMVKIRHTKEVRSRLVVEAKKFWEAVVERHEGAARQYDALQKRFLTEEEFSSAVLDVLAKLPKLDDSPSKRDLTTYEKIEAKRVRLTYLWDNGMGHAGNRSAWEAYNAVTQSLDHDEDTWKVRGARNEALMVGGTLEKPKETVLKNLVALATAK